jgi:hypothetical protein
MDLFFQIQMKSLISHTNLWFLIHAPEFQKRKCNNLKLVQAQGN